jgi:hypothetical protein
LFQDYDWADEVLHAQIGRRWLLPHFEGLSREEVLEQGRGYMANIGDSVDKYRQLGEQHNWWPDFVRKVLGKETAVEEFAQPVITSG